MVFMEKFNLGIDIGSTTAKLVVLKNSEIIYKSYERHFSQVKEKTIELLNKAKELIGNNPITIAMSGSAGMGLASSSNIEFVQEVYATSKTVKLWQSDTSAVIELGGEDAKIIFLLLSNRCSSTVFAFCFVIVFLTTTIFVSYNISVSQMPKNYLVVSDYALSEYLS